MIHWAHCHLQTEGGRAKHAHASAPASEVEGQLGMCRHAGHALLAARWPLQSAPAPLLASSMGLPWGELPRPSQLFSEDAGQLWAALAAASLSPLASSQAASPPPPWDSSGVGWQALDAPCWQSWLEKLDWAQDGGSHVGGANRGHGPLLPHVRIQQRCDGNTTPSWLSTNPSANCEGLLNNRSSLAGSFLPKLLVQ